MTVQPPGGAGGPASAGLADVIDTILDKGLVIDAYARVSLVGIEVLSIEARIVVAGVETYLRFAEAVNRLDLAEEEPQKEIRAALQGEPAKERAEGPRELADAAAVQPDRQEHLEGRERPRVRRRQEEG